MGSKAGTLEGVGRLEHLIEYLCELAYDNIIGVKIMCDIVEKYAQERAEIAAKEAAR